MTVLLSIEASQPNGKYYRLAIGCSLYPLAWMVALLGRLF
jgi:hypothetical protein